MIDRKIFVTTDFGCFWGKFRFWMFGFWRLGLVYFAINQGWNFMSWLCLARRVISKEVMDKDLWFFCKVRLKSVLFWPVQLVTRKGEIEGPDLILVAKFSRYLKLYDDDRKDLNLCGLLSSGYGFCWRSFIWVQYQFSSSIKYRDDFYEWQWHLLAFF